MSAFVYLGIGIILGFITTKRDFDKLSSYSAGDAFILSLGIAFTLAYFIVTYIIVLSI